MSKHHQLFTILGALALSLACTTSYAELEEEVQNVIHINASLDDDEDNSIYPENWSDRKKILMRSYNPAQDSSQDYLSNSRYFVINGQNAVRYFPLSKKTSPALLYTEVGGKNFFALVQSYGTSRQVINIASQLPHHLKDHQLFSIQPHGKNIVLIFRSRYFYSPKEIQHNTAFSQSFSSYLYRSSYELIEVNIAGKILYRTQFTSPFLENGMGFGPSMEENQVLEYTTSTPGNYQTAKPYDIEYKYLYQHGKLTKHSNKRSLSVSERVALRDDKAGVNAELIEDEYREMHRNDKAKPSSCLQDFWVYHDKAAPKEVNWGNPWIQRQPALLQTFKKEYESGKTYTWAQFRQHYCDLSH